MAWRERAAVSASLSQSEDAALEHMCPLLRKREKITLGCAALIQLQSVADDKGVGFWDFFFSLDVAHQGARSDVICCGAVTSQREARTQSSSGKKIIN